MIELFFVTCLAADPVRCQDRSLIFAENVGVMTCMMQSQAQLARWVETHPTESVREWKCRMLGEGGRKI